MAIPVRADISNGANFSQNFCLIKIAAFGKIGGMEELQIMKEASWAGGKILKRYFGQTLEISQKSIPADLVTKADIESERAILDILKKYFPDYNYVAEESGRVDNNSGATFFIDPLDGTYNFLTGIAYFGVVIALLKDDRLDGAVTYQPILEQMFYAQRGGGAYLNDYRIEVNDVTDIIRVSAGYTHGYELAVDKQMTDIAAMKSLKLKRVLINWSLAMDFCLLASGKIEVIVNRGCKPHDYLAGKLIAKEAGAMIVDFNGRPEQDEKNDHFIVVNNKLILDKLLTVLKL